MGRGSGAGRGRGGELDESQQGLAFCACGVVTIVSCVMLALSFSILSPAQYGLRYDSVKKELYHDVYNNGRYFLGLGQGFLKYPRRMQYIEYSDSRDGGHENKPIVCWSKEGQEITMEIGLYYRVMREKLLDLYYRFGQDYDSKVEKISRHAIRDTCTKFYTIEFFESRPLIQEAFKAEVNRRVIANVFCTVPLFNLMAIDVPVTFNAAVKKKIVTKQRERTLRYRRDITVTRAEIGVITANATREITVIKADARAKARLTVAAAQVQALRTVLPTEAKEYGALMVDLFGNTTNAAANTVAVAASHVAQAEVRDLLLQYLWAGTLREKVNKIMIGFGAGKSRSA